MVKLQPSASPVLSSSAVEHVFLLRLSVGEVAAMRLHHEWMPDGLLLAGIDFKRQMAELSTLPWEYPKLCV